MDPLHKLWDLYESLLGSEMEEPSPTVGGPNEDDYEHPVIQDRKKVDMARAAGAPAEVAYEKVFGAVDIGDIDQKSQFASTLGRVQNDNNRKDIRIEKDTETPSILAQDEVMQKQAVTTTNFKTPTSKEVPNELQSPPSDEPNVTEELDLQEEFDYNFDLAYLQKYGRA